MLNKQLVTVSVTAFFVCTGLVGSAAVNAQTLEGERVRGEEQPVQQRFSTNFEKRHDRGGFVRAAVGLGWGHERIGESKKQSATNSGLGVFPSVVGGWLPWEQTAVHAGAWGLVGGHLVHLGGGLGLTHYFTATENFWVGGQIGPVTRSQSRPLFREWGFGGEAEIGLGGWTGDHWAVGGSLFGGGSGLDLDGNGRSAGAWKVGLRFHVVYN